MIVFPNSKMDMTWNNEQVELVNNAMNKCIDHASQAVKKSLDELPLVNAELHRRIEDLLSLDKTEFICERRVSIDRI